MNVKSVWTPYVFYFGEKRVKRLEKVTSVVQVSREGENTVDKGLKVFQAHSHVAFYPAKSFGCKYCYAMGPRWFDTISNDAIVNVSQLFDFVAPL